MRPDESLVIPSGGREAFVIPSGGREAFVIPSGGREAPGVEGRPKSYRPRNHYDCGVTIIK